MPQTYSGSSRTWILTVGITLITHIAAQTPSLLPTTASASFPACALSCITLLNAANSCLPPQAPTSNQNTYTGCFCQSSLLTKLKTSPDGTCDAYCPAESDRQLIENWYDGFCAAGTTATTGSNGATTLSTVTAGVTTEIVIAPSTVTTSGTSTPTSSVSSSAAAGGSSSGNQSWIDQHWRWVLAIAVIIVGLVLIVIVAVFLKRRHRRKVEEKRAMLSGFAAPPSTSRGRTPEPALGQEVWGPHQHMAHTRGWEYSHEQNSALSGGGVGLFSGAGKKKGKKARRAREAEKSKNESTVDVSEVGSPDVVAPPPMTERSLRDRETDWYKNKGRAG